MEDFVASLTKKIVENLENTIKNEIEKILNRSDLQQRVEQTFNARFSCEYNVGQYIQAALQESLDFGRIEKDITTFTKTMVEKRLKEGTIPAVIEPEIKLSIYLHIKNENTTDSSV